MIYYFGACSIPAWNAFDEFLLGDVNKISLIHINSSYHRWLIRQGHKFYNLLESGIFQTEINDQVAILDVEDVEIVLGLVCVIANNVMLIGAHHNLNYDHSN